MHFTNCTPLANDTLLAYLLTPSAGFIAVNHLGRLREALVLVFGEALLVVGVEGVLPLYRPVGIR